MGSGGITATVGLQNGVVDRYAAVETTPTTNVNFASDASSTSLGATNVFRMIDSVMSK
jgi:hypothetical protein